MLPERPAINFVTLFWRVQIAVSARSVRARRAAARSTALAQQRSNLRRTPRRTRTATRDPPIQPRFHGRWRRACISSACRSADVTTRVKGQCRPRKSDRGPSAERPRIRWIPRRSQADFAIKWKFCDRDRRGDQPREERGLAVAGKPAADAKQARRRFQQSDVVIS